jgi:hypothetical protein
MQLNFQGQPQWSSHCDNRGIFVTGSKGKQKSVKNKKAPKCFSEFCQTKMILKCELISIFAPFFTVLRKLKFKIYCKQLTALLSDRDLTNLLSSLIFIWYKPLFYNNGKLLSFHNPTGKGQKLKDLKRIFNNQKEELDIFFRWPDDGLFFGRWLANWPAWPAKLGPLTWCARFMDANADLTD